MGGLGASCVRVFGWVAMRVALLLYSMPGFGLGQRRSYRGDGHKTVSVCHSDWG
jgi:hypothetical protein